MADVDARKHDFYRSMFLECVCDTERRNFLKNKTQEGLDDFRKKITEKSYDQLLDSFAEMMQAKTAILFQERRCRPLDQADYSRNINVLSRSKEGSNKCISFLRSELIDFYCSPFGEGKTGPVSSLLLDIKDTVRVVEVAQMQKDPMVCEYSRDPCVICYIQLNYTDQLSLEKKYIYFAFFYDILQKDDLAGLLEYIRRFLSFRFDLKLRIEKDFNGNLFGERIEATWCNDWLSIEKAGAHTDSSGISRLLKEADFNSSKIMDILFSSGQKSGSEGLSAEKENANKQKKIIYRFIYNINISMYYRAAISQGRNPISAVDDIIKEPPEGTKRYYLIEDVLEFTPVGEDKILYGTGEHSDATVMEAINKAALFGKTGTPKNANNKSTGGIPKKKTLTIQRRYLQAFIMDILHNMEKHGKTGCPARIYIEQRQNTQGYLVFCNEVPVDGKGNLNDWCLANNYLLKQAAEFDNSKDSNAQKGMSLGCIAHCMREYGNIVVRYKHCNNRLFFEIKLPIIQY